MNPETNNIHALTVAYVNNIGGTKQKCNTIARELWMWCKSKNNWVTAAHLPGVLNVEVERESKSIHDNMEWKINPNLFHKVCAVWGVSQVDLFASRLNHQVPTYFAWKPDPGAKAIDTFTEDWADAMFYAFPPFNLVGRVLQKSKRDHTCGIIVVPYWPTQSWFAKFADMCIDSPHDLFSRGRDAMTSEMVTTTLTPPFDTPMEDARGTTEDAPAGGLGIQSQIANLSLTDSAKELLLASWRPATRQQYEV